MGTCDASGECNFNPKAIHCTDSDRNGDENGSYGGDTNEEEYGAANPKANRPARCKLEKDRGRCYAGFIKYYFNKISGSCEEFTYEAVVVMKTDLRRKLIVRKFAKLRKVHMEVMITTEDMGRIPKKEKIIVENIGRI